jgi:hypothetical protein
VSAIFLEKDEMKFCLLYALKHFATPISFGSLVTILVWETEILEYFDLTLGLGELLEDKYVAKKIHLDEMCYVLTKLGDETDEFFSSRIPKSVRNRIDHAVDKIKYSTLVNPKSVIGDVVPINETEFMVECKIFDKDSPLMKLSLYAGSRARAEAMAHFFEDNATDIYGKIVKILNRS